MEAKTKIAQLQAELDQLRLEQAASADTLRTQQQKAWAEMVEIPDNWEWCISETGIVKAGPFTRYAGYVYVYVTKRLKAEPLAKWRSGGLSTFSNSWDDGCWQGMKYVRTSEGILTHEGGGTCVLDSPRLCNEEEWQEICVGRIPAKFIR